MTASSGTVGAALTFMVVVEDAVVGAGIGMRIPEGGCAEAERRGLLLHLRQSLLQLSPQSLQEPAETRSPNLLKGVPIKQLNKWHEPLSSVVVIFTAVPKHINIT